MLTVHLRIADPATKKPLPVRLRVTDVSGRYYAPLGRLAVFACGTGEDMGGSVVEGLGTTGQSNKKGNLAF